MQPDKIEQGRGQARLRCAWPLPYTNDGSYPFATDGMYEMVKAHPEAFGRAVE